MELAGIAVSDIGEGCGTDQDQDGGKCKYKFHRPRLPSVNVRK